MSGSNDLSPQDQGPLFRDGQPVGLGEGLGIIGRHLASEAISPFTGLYHAYQSIMADPTAVNDPTTQQQVFGGMAGIAGGDLALAPETELGLRAFPAWHGSRHVFDPTPEAPYGQFDPEAIGTGEGSQVFGHGFYVAGKQSVAKHYTQAGGPSEGSIWLDGKDLAGNLMDLEPHEETAVLSYGRNNGNEWNTREELERRAEDHLQTANDPSNAYYEASARNAYGEPPPYWSDERKAQHEANIAKDAREMRQSDLTLGRHFQDAADWFSGNKDRLAYQPGGSLYQVWVHPREDELLDWDKEYYEQPEDMRLNIESAFPEVADEAEERWNAGKSFTGEDVYNHVAGGQWGDNEEASKRLDEAGVPGIKYRDRMSRKLPEDHPDVTNNYVLFHPRHLSIIDRDGERYGMQRVEGNPFEETGQ